MMIHELRLNKLCGIMEIKIHFENLWNALKVLILQLKSNLNKPIYSRTISYWQVMRTSLRWQLLWTIWKITDKEMASKCHHRIFLKRNVFLPCQFLQAYLKLIIDWLIMLIYFFSASVSLRRTKETISTRYWINYITS